MFRGATALIVAGAAFASGLALAADAQAAPAPQPTIYPRPSLNDVVGKMRTSDGADPEMLAEATATYAEARMPFTLRSRAQILDLFDGFDLVEPGLVSLPEWRPDYNTDRTPLNGPTVGAVARLAA